MHIPRLTTYHDHPRWRREDALVAHDSGLILRRRGAVFRPGHDEEGFLAEAHGVESAAWGWHFTNWDHALDGMAHRYISLKLRRLIFQHFNRVDSFTFHLFEVVPHVPWWLDAEYVSEIDAFVIYGEWIEGSNEDT